MSNKKQEKIKEVRNSLELSSIETAIDCPTGMNTSLTENKENSTLTVVTTKPKDTHDETDFLPATFSLSGLHASIETLATTTDLLMKLEKQLGLGRNTSGSIDEKNKKQDQSCLFVKIWNIVKIIIWIICVYIIIRSFLFSPSDGQSPVENSKILGEKSVIINNIPPSTGIVLNPIQRNETQDFESLLKLAISLQMLLASLKTDEEEVGFKEKKKYMSTRNLIKRKN